MYNHARMWFASIWIFTLELPWELGADFFMRHLLDGDPASNTLSWRWVAGIQTLDKTYLARTSNISKFTDGRFHPKWQLAQHAKPVAAPQKPDPTPLLPSQKPTANLRTGLILHEEDLDPIHVLEGPAPFATAILKPQTNVGPLNSARHVFEFREAAMKDMAARHKDRLGDVSWVEPEDLPSWSEKYNLEQIVTPYAPVGPVATVLDKADLNGISLLKIMRAYDEMAWPQATKGFFPFKKHIPSFVRTLGLQDGTPLLV